MSTLKALRDERAAKAKSLRELMEANPNAWTDDLQAAYDSGMSEIDALDVRISNIHKLNEKLAAENVDGQVAEATARAEKDKPSGALAIYARWLRDGDRALNAADWSTVRNTMSTTTGSQGGFTVATEVAKTVMDALKDYGGMREVSTVIQTAQGNDMSFPTSDGTSETGELIAQNVTATGADPTFGTVSLPVYKFSSKIVAVPIELLQDSSVDMEAFIRTRLATRLGRVTNTYFTTGTGSSQPNGIVTAAAAGRVGATGQTTTVIYDDLVDLVHAVDPAYRALGRARFMMNDASVKVIRKLKDSQNRPLWMPGYELGITGAVPDQLLGYPVQINQDMAAMAANAKSILFGDFSFYIIRDAMLLDMARYDDSAYGKLGQVGFLAWLRSGGTFTDVGGAVKYYQNSAT